MNKFLASALGLGLLMAVPTSLSAQSGARPQAAARDQASQPKAPQQKNARPSQNAYGSWDAKWGARPSDPPKHFTRNGDWYRHVRACQQKYRSYNARTDTYRTHAGLARRCTV